MNIGLDIHGCIDKYPSEFRELTHRWYRNKHSIYIITGQSWSEVVDEVDGAGVAYTDTFSIVDHHLKIWTPMWKNDPRGKGWWMDATTWLLSKGTYCQESNINIHFDDTLEYAQYFPRSNCSFILVPKTGFDKIYKSFMDI